MALKDWMIAFNDAKEMETNGEEGPDLVKAYKLVVLHPFAFQGLSARGSGLSWNHRQHGG